MKIENGFYVLVEEDYSSLANVRITARLVLSSADPYNDPAAVFV